MKKYALRGFLTIVCSFGLTHFTTAQSDSIRLSPDGFRKVLLQRSELAECNELLVVASKKVRLMEMRVDLKNVQITSFQAIRDSQATDIKKLKRLVWKKNFQIGCLLVLSTVLGYGLVF